MSETTAILLIAWQDQKSLVARASGFIHDYGGNILDSDSHTDRETGDFLMRTVFDLSEFRLACAEDWRCGSSDSQHSQYAGSITLVQYKRERWAIPYSMGFICFGQHRGTDLKIVHFPSKTRMNIVPDELAFDCFGKQ